MGVLFWEMYDTEEKPCSLSESIWAATNLTQEPNPKAFQCFRWCCKAAWCKWAKPPLLSEPSIWVSKAETGGIGEYMSVWMLEKVSQEFIQQTQWDTNTVCLCINYKEICSHLQFSLKINKYIYMILGSTFTKMLTRICKIVFSLTFIHKPPSTSTDQRKPISVQYLSGVQHLLQV